MDDDLHAFSPEALHEMRTASRSPNKRSFAERASLPHGNGTTASLATQHPSAHTVSNTRLIAAPPTPLATTATPALVTPFKRFRADSLLSPQLKCTTASSNSHNSQQLSRFARRRNASTFQSLADDRFAVCIVERPTHKQSIDDTSTSSISQSSSQGELLPFTQQLESSPDDVAAYCELLECSETLADELDALNVVDTDPSSSHWRWQYERRRPDAAVAAAAAAVAAPLRHRRSVVQRQLRTASRSIDVLDDDVVEAAAEQTQQLSDSDEAEIVRPVFVAIAHFPLDGGCACLDRACTALALERSWQHVYSPTPHAGFDPRCCSAHADDGDDASAALFAPVDEEVASDDEDDDDEAAVEFVWSYRSECL